MDSSSQIDEISAMNGANENVGYTPSVREQFGKAQKRNLGKKWNCMCPECPNKTINSHLLQQKGILDTASKSHKFREFRYRHPSYWHEKDRCEFKSLGINEALSYPVFCKFHDDYLFKQIEMVSPDWNNYQNLLLLCYRTLCCDIRKCEIALNHWTELQNIDKVSFPIERYAGLIDNTMNEVLQLDSYLKELSAELNDPQNRYCFKHFIYPKLEVYASASYGANFEYGHPNGMIQQGTIYFVHIIPTHNKIEVIFGYPKEHADEDGIRYIESWKDIDATLLGKKLTELFADKIENWGMSEELYQCIPEETRSKFVAYMNQNGYMKDELIIDFNLFDGLIDDFKESKVEKR